MTAPVPDMDRIAEGDGEKDGSEGGRACSLTRT